MCYGCVITDQILENFNIARCGECDKIICANCSEIVLGKECDLMDEEPEKVEFNKMICKIHFFNCKKGNPVRNQDDFICNNCNRQ